MKELTIYNKESGYIRQSMTQSSDIVNPEQMLEEGEAYIEGIFDPSIYEKIVDGEGVLKDTTPNYENENRRHRSALLYRSDWTQMLDGPLSDSKKAEWATYRQTLRDITSHSNWPNLEEADWPTQPS